VGTQAAVALGGVAALSWEVLWQLEASLSLGVSAAGTAITLAATMAGMTIGSLGMGRILRHRAVPRPLLVYGGLEAVIGLCGLLLLRGFELVETIDALAYGVSPALAPLVHALSIALLLGPAALAMGATVPLFELVGRATGTSVARLYGINTMGAALGVVIFSFLLVPALGVSRTCMVVAAINFFVLFATAGLGWFSRLRTAASARSEEASALGRAVVPIGSAALVAFGTGFVTFGLEVAWFRSLRAAFHSTSESFAIILVSVLIPLAVSARLVPWLRRRGVSPREALLAAGVAILLATPLIERMDEFVHFIVESLRVAERSGQQITIGLTVSYTSVLGVWLVSSMVVIGPAILFLGVALPWYLEEFAEPGATGRLYGVNTLGAVAGSLICAWLLLPSIGFARCTWLLGIVTVCLATLAPGWRLLWPGLAAAATALAIAITTTADLGTQRVQRPDSLGRYEIIAFDEGPDSTVAVVEEPDGSRVLLIDGFNASSDGTLGTSYMKWMGHLPMILHPHPQRALVICFGTGQTANAVRREGSDALDIVDVDGTVLQMAPHFESNERVLEDPRVRSIVMDGRAWLRRVESTYDVITLEPMPPHFAGVNALYSREFYEIAASRLAHDGVVAQWLPIHILPPFYASSVIATFVEVFPDSILWVDPSGGTGVLLGRRPGSEMPLAKDWPGLARSLARPLPSEAIEQAALLNAVGLQLMAEAGRVITDDNQLLAYGLVRGHLIGGRFKVAKQQNFRRIHAVAKIQPDL